MMIGILLAGSRAVEKLKIFRKFRILILQIAQSFSSIIPFATFLIMIVVLLTTVNSQLIKEEIPDDFDFKQHYLRSIQKQYQLIWGENPDGSEMSSLEWVAYLVFTIIINIVALNLIITLIGETFDEVQSTSVAYHTHVKLNILQEISILMFWKRNQNSL